MATNKQAGANPPATRQAKEKTTYTVGNTPLLLDGERYEPGDNVELTAAQAQRLAVRPVKPVNQPELKE